MIISEKNVFIFEGDTIVSNYQKYTDKYNAVKHVLHNVSLLLAIFMTRLECILAVCTTFLKGGLRG